MLLFYIAYYDELQVHYVFNWSYMAIYLLVDYLEI
jgi:hypothetical protein